MYSHTRPRENIVRYRPWYLRRPGSDWEARGVLEGRIQGKGVVARLEGCEDRDQARQLIGCEIGIRREQLPAPAQGEYYWADLVGLEVKDTAGVSLGRVVHLFDTGANDVMVVQGERERLIPFVTGRVVLEVDIATGCIRVDWDRDF